MSTLHQPADGELVLFKDATQIQARVQALGITLARSHATKRPVVVGLLSGAFVFMADLVRAMDIPCEVDFWRLSSYGVGRNSTGEITEPVQLETDVHGRHVIVVEDIVDTGATLAHVRAELARKTPASVTVVALLRSRKSSVHVDHVGFESGDHFVVGYGLDLAYAFRNLPDLYYHVVDT